MPVIGTLGSIAEFRQGYIQPFPPDTAVAVPTPTGIGGNITVTPNTANTGSVITFYATSTPGNYTGNSLGLSNNIYVGQMDPFYNYTFDVQTRSAGGNSNGNTVTNSIFVSCNVSANGSLSLPTIGGNTQDMKLSSDGTRVYATTSGTFLYVYYRNDTTGQLTSSAGVLPPNAFSVFGVAVTNDNRNMFLSGISNVIVGNTITYESTLWNYEIQYSGNLTNLTLVQTLTKTGNANPNFVPISATPDGQIITLIRTNLSATSFTADGYIRNTSTGLLTTAYTSLPLPITAGGLAATQGRLISTNDSLNQYFSYSPATSPSDKTISIIRKSGNTIIDGGTVIVSNALGTLNNIKSSNDNKNIYAFGYGNIYNYSRNVVNGNLTFVATTSASAVIDGVIPTNNLMIAANATANATLLYDRDTTTGALSKTSNTTTNTSYAFNANSTRISVISPDLKNIYVLNSNNIAIFNIRST